MAWGNVIFKAPRSTAAEPRAEKAADEPYVMWLASLQQRAQSDALAKSPHSEWVGKNPRSHAVDLRRQGCRPHKTTPPVSTERTSRRPQNTVASSPVSIDSPGRSAIAAPRAAASDNEGSSQAGSSAA